MPIKTSYSGASAKFPTIQLRDKLSIAFLMTLTLSLLTLQQPPTIVAPFSMHIAIYDSTFDSLLAPSQPTPLVHDSPLENTKDLNMYFNW